MRGASMLGTMTTKSFDTVQKVVLKLSMRSC